MYYVYCTCKALAHSFMYMCTCSAMTYSCLYYQLCILSTRAVLLYASEENLILSVVTFSVIRE